MYDDAREFVTALGGYRFVAVHLDKRPTTVHLHMQSGVFPAAWYDAFCELARKASVEEPPRTLFSFLQLEERKDARVNTAQRAGQTP